MMQLEYFPLMHLLGQQVLGLLCGLWRLPMLI